MERQRVKRQPVKIKVRFFEDSVAEIFIQQIVHTATIEMMIFFFFTERKSHTRLPTCFNFKSKFPLFAKKSLIFKNVKISEIDVLCLHLITRYTTQFMRKNKTFHLAI